MFEFLLHGLTATLSLLNQIQTVGIAITALGLLLYTATFNLRNRAARALWLLLLATFWVYSGDVAALILAQPEQLAQITFWLRLQWLGIILMPAAFFHLSDAVLATTGQPSRGRRRWAERIGYFGVFCISILALNTSWVVGPVVMAGTTRSLQAGPAFAVFAELFLLGICAGTVNLYRAYRRALTQTVRQRTRTLLLAALAVAVSVFPFLLVAGGSLANAHPSIFLLIANVGNVICGGALVNLVYTVSFIDNPRADRVIKISLYRWFLRGPFVASLVVTAYVLTRWICRYFHWDSTLILPPVMVAAGLLPQFALTLFMHPLERLLFVENQSDRNDLLRLNMLSDRLLTAADARQLLESILATACDILHVESGFVAIFTAGGTHLETTFGAVHNFRELQIPFNGESISSSHPQMQPALAGLAWQWEQIWLFPLRAQSQQQGLANEGEWLGLLGLSCPAVTVEYTADDYFALRQLVQRAASTLEDLRLQRQIFTALDTLLLKVDQTQRMQTESRATGGQILPVSTATDALVAVPTVDDAAQWVREALTHYWGGPKLTSSPLLRLRVVRQMMRDGDDNAVQALRTLLRNAIDHIRPPGQRKFTAEWMLYNILELKFLEGRKVRDVAMQLAVSEADLYRKQRVAIDELAAQILAMEASTDASVAPIQPPLEQTPPNSP
jgi:hypothetical protein